MEEEKLKQNIFLLEQFTRFKIKNIVMIGFCLQKKKII